MDLARMLQQAQGGGGGGGGAEAPIMDTAETIQISSLALLKMLKHGAHYPCGRGCSRRPQEGRGGVESALAAAAAAVAIAGRDLGGV
eukprot:SAG22_NODE_422_length_10687_cov_4.448149_7_plen_87_part_00